MSVCILGHSAFDKDEWRIRILMNNLWYDYGIKLKDIYFKLESQMLNLFLSFLRCQEKTGNDSLLCFAHIYRNLELLYLYGFLQSGILFYCWRIALKLFWSASWNSRFSLPLLSVELLSNLFNRLASVPLAFC